MTHTIRCLVEMCDFRGGYNHQFSSGEEVLSLEYSQIIYEYFLSLLDYTYGFVNLVRSSKSNEAACSVSLLSLFLVVSKKPAHPCTR